MPSPSTTTSFYPLPDEIRNLLADHLYPRLLREPHSQRSSYRQP